MHKCPLDHVQSLELDLQLQADIVDLLEGLLDRHDDLHLDHVPSAEMISSDAIDLDLAVVICADAGQLIDEVRRRPLANDLFDLALGNVKPAPEDV